MTLTPGTPVTDGEELPLAGPPQAEDAPRRFQRMPDNVRSLGEPWHSLAGKVPGLTAELERDFRFGQTVFPFSGGYRLGGSLKGGSSTTWRPAAESDYRAYGAWKEQEGIPDQPEDLEAFELLARHLAANKVEFWNLGHKFSPRMPAEYLPKRGWIYRTALEIMQALPEEHIRRETFSALQLGGWGPASAKASAFENNRVFIYDFALGGAKRTMVGLFLHELGHAQESSLSATQLEELTALHAPIAEGNALFGLEFLLDAESRKVYQQFLVTEFAAETYVAYTAAGSALRRHIEDQEDAAIASAWRGTYALFKEAFGGVEYE